MTTKNQFWTEEEIEDFYGRILYETFRRFPGLTKYESIFSFVFHAFYEQGGLIHYQDNKEGAYVNPDMFKGRYVLNLCIGVKGRKDPITVLWSILHEYGHTLQPAITDEIHNSPKLKFERETDAWNRAEAKLADFKLSEDDLDNFKSFRTARLQHYQVKIK